MNKLPALALSLIILISAFSCEKELSATGSPATVSTDTLDIPSVVSAVPFPLIVHPDCTNAPNYGDSIVYPQATTGADFIVLPTVSSGAGTYLSWPEGLSIDPASGAIDITHSQTGQRYTIGFVKAGGTDTCLSSLIVAGSSYMDSVYNTDFSNSVSAPYFNANPDLPSECAVGDGCRFDINGKAKGKGLEINKETGIINVKNSRKAFGEHPFNGQVAAITILYSLNDQTHNAVQSMTVNLVYYDRIGHVPAAVSALITEKRMDILTNQILLTTHGNPKPPLIIITRN